MKINNYENSPTFHRIEYIRTIIIRPISKLRCAMIVEELPLPYNATKEHLHFPHIPEDTK